MGVGAMPAPPADGRGMESGGQNPGEWESWAREAETLWAAVSARKPRLEVSSASGRAGRESAAGRDASGVPETHAAWPAARLFTPGANVTPPADAVLAASAAPPASRGPSASVIGVVGADARPPVSASETDVFLFRDERASSPTDAVAAFVTASKAALLAERRRGREMRPVAVAARAWKDVERAYLRAVRADGPLAGTPLALRGADAARVALTETDRFGPRVRETRDVSEYASARSALASLPFPHELVDRSFRAWRRRRATTRGARLFAERREKTRLALALRLWRDDVLRERARAAVLAAVAFETWLGRVVVSRARIVAVASARTRALRLGATGAWRAWRAAADTAAEKKASADSVRDARRAAKAFRVWCDETDASSRDRAWCAFAETWHARGVAARAVSLWRRRVAALLAARDAAEATRLEKRRVRHHTAFFLWRRRASTLAAGRELVRLACVKWRFETTERVFGAFRAAASAKRARRTASAAFYETKLSSKALARWRARVAVAVNGARARRCVDAWRLTVFHGRERDRRATEACFARTRRVCFRGWVDVAEAAAGSTDRLLAETRRLGWPDRVRSRRAFVMWRERATHSAAYRARVEAEVIVRASRNRVSRCAARWRLNAAEAILAQLQARRAKRHRLVRLLTAYRLEVARRIRARLVTQAKLGMTAIRKLAICHAGWRAFVAEMRPIRRRLRRLRETTRAGHTVAPDASRFRRERVSRRPPRVDAKDVSGVSAALRREARDAADAATVGPLVAAAARARVKTLLESRRRGIGTDAEHTFSRLAARLGKVWSAAAASETADAFGAASIRVSARDDSEHERPPASPRVLETPRGDGTVLGFFPARVARTPSPSRASEGFRSAPSSAPSSARVSATASRASSADPSPAKAARVFASRRTGPDMTVRARDGSATTAETAVRVLRARVAARRATTADASPTAVSWSPSPRVARGPRRASLVAGPPPAFELDVGDARAFR